MKYLCLIYNDPQSPAHDDAVFDDVMKEYFALNDELEAAGRYIAAEALQEVETARTVRTREGETVTTDGPFAETKEVLGGFYLIECDSMEQALAYAEKIPATRHGSVEVRPILELPGRA